MYRKGGGERTPWAEEHATAHWAELNPGILNQFRTLFHLAGKPEEAAALTYAGSTEETVEAAALRLSQLLGGKPAILSLSQLFYDEPADEKLSFEIVVKADLKNIPGKKDWYGGFDILRNGESLAVWHIQTDHSYLQLASRKTNVFALEKSFTNPYVIGQLEVLNHVCWHNGIEDTEERRVLDLCQQQFPLKLEALKTSPQMFEMFFTHANLSNEHFRNILTHWCKNQDGSIFFPIVHKILWGMTQVDGGREISNFVSITGDLSDPFSCNHITQKLSSFVRNHFQSNDEYNQACLNYKTRLRSSDVHSLVPENRCQGLFFDLQPTSPQYYDPWSWGVSQNKVIEVLSNTTFSYLNYLVCSFAKDCSTEKVSQIAQLLPKTIEEISINNSISPEHLWAFSSNLKSGKATCHVYISDLYQYQNQNNYQLLPPTQQEYAYQLLLPFAKAGRSFEPPFIELHADEDLEPVYEQLRIVAALHKQPEFLMIEDGVAH